MPPDHTDVPENDVEKFDLELAYNEDEHPGAPRAREDLEAIISEGLIEKGYLGISVSVEKA